MGFPFVYFVVFIFFRDVRMAEGSGHFTLKTQQITHGPSENHFFGYIGHAGTVPWSSDGRYIVCLRTTFQDHMPGRGEPADICLLDTANGYVVEKVDQTEGWNPQQGTMLYWNPDAPDTQFFFNDANEDGKIFTVLYDVSTRTRVKEYRYAEGPFGNSGVAQQGGWFCGLNYARMARLRRVTGYVDTWDWTVGVDHPEDDGIFKVDIATGEWEVIVSFAQLAEAIAPTHDGEPVPALFINHTLCNRANDRIYFYARAGWGGNPGKKVNQPFTVRPDGSELTLQTGFVGGHPEWEAGETNRIIGERDGKLVLWDTDLQDLVGQIGTPDIIKGPRGDTALSLDGQWTVTGYGIEKHYNEWAVYRRTDGAWARTDRYDQRPYVKGDLRSDPAPLWHPDGSQILFPSMVADGSRQLHVIAVEA
ncbi:MAG: hypothetical protein CME19_04360 [Gemmatimonadetes bacterium]|nr:hypothetical protein [Gemmatimonadota bacterium]